MLTRCPSIVAALLLAVAGISAQSPVTVGNVVQGTGTIQAIDTTSRTITVRNEKGEEDSFVAGPQVTRFSELKVGDKINLTYYESTVYQVQPPGAAPAATRHSFVSLGPGEQVVEQPWRHQHDAHQESNRPHFAGSTLASSASV
jgi:hypothetical protein